MRKVECISNHYSTTKLCYKLLDNKYLNKNEKIKEDLKFTLNFPEFGIVDSKIPAKENEKFDTLLFLPEGEDRKGEGGLRTKGYFKFSYEKKDGKWWIVKDGKFIKEVEIDEKIVKDYERLPLITIVTVVYNGEKYLEETIQSVINQTYPNIEYIIIDGGSTDNTLEIIKKYEEYIDYWISEKDNGIYDAMNKGIKCSLGKIIGIINSDDYYEINIFDYVINVNDFDILYGNMYLIDDKKNILNYRIPKDWKLYFGMSLNHPATFVKTHIYKKKIYNCNYKLAADYEFLLYNKLKKTTFKYVNQNFAYMRDGGESVINANETRLEEKIIKRKLLGKLMFFLSEIVLLINKIRKIKIC